MHPLGARASRPHEHAGVPWERGRRARTSTQVFAGSAGVAPARARRRPLGARASRPLAHATQRRRRMHLTEVDFLASPGVPSLVSAIRTPKLPLLPLWEKGAGGMRGNGAREYRTSRISPKNSTLERAHASPGSAGVAPARARRRPLGARASRPLAHATQRRRRPQCLRPPRRIPDGVRSRQRLTVHCRLLCPL
jgi:hypothetical protein